MRLMMILLGVALFAQAQETSESTIPFEKWKSEFTEKTWGLKIKSVRVGQYDVNVVLEFTKDLTPEEVKAAKEVFVRKEGCPEFCFFDEDNVIIAKAGFMNYTVQGDISGKKGDAIRCTIGTRTPELMIVNDPMRAKKVTKVELRPANPN